MFSTASVIIHVTVTILKTAKQKLIVGGHTQLSIIITLHCLDNFLYALLCSLDSTPYIDWKLLCNAFSR